MLRLSLTVIGWLLTSLQLQAQESKSLLWEISGNGLQSPSYVFGTMHILCSAQEMMSDSLIVAINASKEVYFEIDMDNPGEIMGVFKHIRMTNNKKLADLLTDEEYQRVKQYFANNKTMLPLSMMERFKPYFVAAMLSESKMPCGTKTGMEDLIMQQAKKNNTPIKGLETMEFQASVFDSIPYAEQAKELLKAIDEEDKQDSMTNRMADVYRQQDLDAIEKMTLDEEGGVSNYLELFLYGRNAKWIAPMEAAMKTHPVLFAVGAAHLPGEKGVLALLRKQGYRVRSVKSTYPSSIL